MINKVRIMKKKRKSRVLVGPIGAIIGLICLVQLTQSMNKNRGRWILKNHGMEI